MQCIIYCPVQAIQSCKEIDLVTINQYFCVECGVCRRSDICSSDAFIPLYTDSYHRPQSIIARFRRKIRTVGFRFMPQLLHLKNPRFIRQILSDPTVSFPLTGVYGRGTEEIKANDVTRRFKSGDVGFCIEVGRPGKSAALKEVESFTIPLAKLGVSFVKENPVTWLMSDKYGHIRKRYRNERVLSAIIEFAVKESEIEKIINFIKQVNNKATTIFTVSVICKISANDEMATIKELDRLGMIVNVQSKINLGLGSRLLL